ncbi:MAG: DUF4388 domain-containing protein [Candidatus Schekmanbacteria bacterium]|nr:DUF4388 domain-containing protein [Candidatus Schekmanbacteria bacterium]
MRPRSLARSIFLRLLIAVACVPVLNTAVWFNHNRQLEIMFEDQARLMGKLFSPICASALAGQDYEFLQQTLTESLTSANLLYGVITDRDGRVAAFGDRRLSISPGDDPIARRADQARVELVQEFSHRALRREVLDVAVPLAWADGRAGTLRLGLLLAPDRPREAQREKSVSYARGVSLKVRALPVRDPALLAAALRQLLAQNEVLYAIVSQGDHRIASVVQPAVAGKVAAPLPGGGGEDAAAAGQTVTRTYDEALGEMVADVVTPLFVRDGVRRGTVFLGLATSRFAAESHRMLVVVAILNVSLVLVLVILSVWSCHEVGAPMRRIAMALGSQAPVAGGSLPAKGGREIREVVSLVERIRVATVRYLTAATLRGLAGEGLLADLSLGEIIRNVAVAGRTGVIEVQGPVAFGSVELRRGRPLHATTGEVAGEEAVHEMLGWQVGTFRIVDSMPKGDVQTIHASWQTLVLEGLRGLEARQLSQEMFSGLSSKVLPLEQPSQITGFTLTDDEREVSLALSRPATILEIAAEAAMEPEHVREILYRFAIIGLVMPDDP